jgi:hypothetical protein
MKKLKMFAAAAAFCAMQMANAQTHDVSLNIAPIIFSNYSVNYSFNFEEDMSVIKILKLVTEQPTMLSKVSISLQSSAIILTLMKGMTAFLQERI